MSKRSANSAELDGHSAVKEHRQDKEVKHSNTVDIWLASVTDAMVLVRNMKFDELKFPPLPERQAVLDYLNALRLTDQQVLEFEQLCRKAPDYIRPRVDKTHHDFERANRYIRRSPNDFKVDPEFTQAYKNTALLWPWLVERATAIRWDADSDVLAFIFYTLFQVCGLSAVEHMTLWERVLVGHHPHKTCHGSAPQVAVSQVFFSAVFDYKLYKLWYAASAYHAHVHTYLAAVVVHNTFVKNEVDVEFAGYTTSNTKVFHYDEDCGRPVQAKEICLESLVQEIKEQLATQTF